MTHTPIDKLVVFLLQSYSDSIVIAAIMPISLQPLHYSNIYIYIVISFESTLSLPILNKIFHNSIIDRNTIHATMMTSSFVGDDDDIEDDDDFNAHDDSDESNITNHEYN